MSRILVVVALLTAAPVVPVLPVQAAAAAAADSQTQCADTPQKKAKRSIFGGILADAPKFEERQGAPRLPAQTAECSR